MNKILAVLLLMMMGLMFVSGCTLPDSCSENTFRTLKSWDLDAKMAVQDTKDVLLLNRPSHLTYWYVYFGDY